MRRFAVVVLSVAMTAQAEPMEAGLAWLRAQQGPDGVLGASLGEQPLVATTEALATWKALGLEAQPETLAALAAVKALPFGPDTELKLRRHLALQGTPWAFPVSTFAGHAEGFDAPEPWLMAWVLLTGPADAGWVTRANALGSQIDSQGCLGWADNGPSAEVVAMAVLALGRRADVTSVSSARAALVGCLLAQQRGGGAFGGAGATAMSLLALQSVSLDVASAMAAANSALLAMQASDGSWGSVRATALALRALGAASPGRQARSDFNRAVGASRAGTALQGAPVAPRAHLPNASAVTALAPEGGRSLVVSASDRPGNTTTRSPTFTPDFTAPAITTTGVADGATGTSFTGGHCIDSSVVAERRYSPSEWADSRYTFSSPIRLAVPWTLDVTAGNVGNQKAYLFFGSSGRTTRCEYVAAGLGYRFEHCTNGLTAGTLTTTDSLRLHVHEGDSKRGPTAVTWRLQESSPCAGATAQDSVVRKHCGHEAVACEGAATEFEDGQAESGQ